MQQPDDDDDDDVDNLIVSSTLGGLPSSLSGNLSRRTTATTIHTCGYQLRRSPIAKVSSSTVTVIHRGSQPLQ